MRYLDYKELKNEEVEEKMRNTLIKRSRKDVEKWGNRIFFLQIYEPKWKNKKRADD